MEDMTYAEWLDTATEMVTAAAKDFPDSFVQDGVLYERTGSIGPDDRGASAYYKDERGRCVLVYEK
jgi:hypothetical protein